MDTEELEKATLLNTIIVDDERIVRLGLRTLINWGKYNLNLLAECKNGEEALNIIEGEDVSLVITDLKMPKMDGLTLIRKLKEKQFKGKILVLSNYDDYELVRKAMKLGAWDYLLKISIEEDEFELVLDKVVKEIQKDAIMIQRIAKKKNITYSDIPLDERIEEEVKNYILGMDNEEKIIDYINRKQFGINLKANRVFYISVNHIRNLKDRQRFEDKEVFDRSIQNILKDCLKMYGRGEIISLGYRSYIGILPTYLDETRDTLRSLCENIINAVKMYMNIDVTMVMGYRNISVEKLKDEVQNCREMVKYNFYYKCPIYFFLEEMAVKPLHLQMSLYQYGEKLRREAKRGQFDKTREMLAKMLNNHKELKIADPQELKETILLLLQNYISLLIEKNYPSIHEINKEKEKLLKINYIEDFAKAVDDYILKMKDILTQLNNRKYGQLTEEAITYIETNYQKKMSLKDIAKALNVSEGYLSRNFKKDVGLNMTEFIRDFRLEIAKELILNTELYMKEIASNIGIADAFYFDRMFKKKFGVSPSDYKKQAKGNNCP